MNWRRGGAEREILKSGMRLDGDKYQEWLQAGDHGKMTME